MRAIFLALMASALSFPAVAEKRSSPYICKDFVRDYSEAEKKSVSASDMSLRFNQIAGFIVGIYYASNDARFPVDNDNPIYLFEREVLSLCLRRPQARPEAIALEVARASRPSKPAVAAPTVQPYSPSEDVSLGEPTIEYDELIGFARLIYQVTNKMDHPIGVSIRCGLYDENELALGQSGGWVNGIPPQQTVVGEGLASVSRIPVRADCRIIRIRRQ